MKDLTKKSTDLLLGQQQILGMANQQMTQLINNMEELVKQGQISSNYFKDFQQEIGQKIEKNNDFYYDIDKELMKRMQKDFPGCTTPNIMTKLYSRVEKHMEEYKNMIKPKGPTPDEIMKEGSDAPVRNISEGKSKAKEKRV